MFFIKQNWLSHTGCSTKFKVYRVQKTKIKVPTRKSKAGSHVDNLECNKFSEQKTGKHHQEERKFGHHDISGAAGCVIVAIIGLTTLSCTEFQSAFFYIFITYFFAFLSRTQPLVTRAGRTATSSNQSFSIGINIQWSETVLHPRAAGHR